ncbi:hypothetical protein LJC46_05375 [Desulfovibrio sp. OttesenSCG-928-G15]|nr:hypothetical protein [Desulfovibrio sp. OttesenSCG-928-G15]
MDYEALVRTITENVLAKLRADRPFALLPGAGAAPGPAARPTPRVLVLAAPDAAGRVEMESWMRGLFGPTAGLQFFTGPEANQVFDRYILPTICCADMAALATGRATGPVTRKVLELLLAGQKVEVLEFTYTRQAANAPAALYRLYENYEKTLASFGLTRFIAAQSASGLAASGNAGVSGPVTCLITGKDVEYAAEHGVTTISVPVRGIVTALARDMAKELGIHIAKDGGI